MPRHAGVEAAPLLLDFPSHRSDACWKVERALREQGIDYEVVKHGYGKGQRPELQRLSGQRLLRVLELADGTVYREESDAMAARVHSGELSGSGAA